MLNWGHCRARDRHPSLAVVFLDSVSLSVRDDGYWNSWIVPHVFFLVPDPVLLAPEGWEERLHTFDHWTLGGSMIKYWSLIIWYPPGILPREPVTVPFQPWIPLHARIDEMISRHLGRLR